MLIDSNVLIYSLNTNSPKVMKARDFLSKNRSRLIYSQQTLYETLRVVTHRVFPNPLETARAVNLIEGVVADSRIIGQNEKTWMYVTMLLGKYGIRGSEIFDTVLVATALSNGVGQIVTDNVRHLGKYEEIEVVGLG